MCNPWSVAAPWSLKSHIICAWWMTNSVTEWSGTTVTASWVAHSTSRLSTSIWPWKLTLPNLLSMRSAPFLTLQARCFYAWCRCIRLVIFTKMWSLTISWSPYTLNIKYVFLIWALWWNTWGTVNIRVLGSTASRVPHTTARCLVSLDTLSAGGMTWSL